MTGLSRYFEGVRQGNEAALLELFLRLPKISEVVELLQRLMERG